MLKGSVTLILFLTLLLKLFMPPYSHMFSCYKIITLLMTDPKIVMMCCRACMLEPWRHRTRRTLSRATSPYSCPAPVSRAPPPPPHAPRADPRSALRLRRSSVVRAAETPGPGGAEDGGPAGAGSGEHNAVTYNYLTYLQLHQLPITTLVTYNYLSYL